MKFSIVSLALFVAGVTAQLTINTPASVISCAPLQMSFQGGTPPYIILIYPGATPNGPNALVTFNNVTGSPFVWTSVNVASGTSLDITLRDSTGASAQSAPFTVQSGGSTSCLNGTASGSNAGTAATPAATSPTSAAATTPTGTTPAGSQSKAGAGTTGTSTAKSSSSSGNAAVVAGIPYGMAGILGAVVAAVFV